MRPMRSALALLVPLLVLPAAVAEDGPSLSPGDPAPAFALPGSDGRSHSLEDHRGQRAVVLAWFPKAFTSG